MIMMASNGHFCAVRAQRLAHKLVGLTTLGSKKRTAAAGKEPGRSWRNWMMARGVRVRVRAP